MWNTSPFQCTDTVLLMLYHFVAEIYSNFITVGNVSLFKMNILGKFRSGAIQIFSSLTSILIRKNDNKPHLKMETHYFMHNCSQKKKKRKFTENNVQLLFEMWIYTRKPNAVFEGYKKGSNNKKFHTKGVWYVWHFCSFSLNLSFARGTCLFNK